ncbi:MULTISPECIES: polyphosphate polymerase domain-containing protein [Gordonibacter]|uniref:Polyphosphate polymerase domain-containing protein n=1 Tax=Gordonibacter faecis TaxID=3047475 RepID=A0ABT7DPA0_9ACTN|nr:MULTISPECIES: polyphosphate polymerase domain-containing protein [unclassified Gordonibacter]MDJ1651374.1 polyphosphate polymerase domain-containing protein [Gordonibacter sp. KGMB12511]HIW75341.1 polyphosphate polymerase domain-containing protein [Candidatus Gordonibacter avicola]
MSVYTDVFERKEVKYRLGAEQVRALAGALEGRMVPDAYGRTRVTSLYLDTPNRALIDRSLEKPLYKEKLRLRAYGTPAPDGLVFIELKKKFEGIVYKRRVGCSYRAARAYVAGTPYERACARFPLADHEAAVESCSPRSLQIAAEIDQFRARHKPLMPSMYIACERVAYAPALDVAGEPHADVPPDLRITFDEAIAYRDLFASVPAPPDAPSAYVPLLGAGEAVMEIKASGPFPLWLVHALDECRVYPTSFSKYGEAYRACSNAPRPRPVNVRAEAKAERLAATLHAARPRHLSAPIHHLKKGGRCA